MATFSFHLQPQGLHAEPIRKLDSQTRLDILLEMRLGSVVEQGFA
jgi:hypothetical protein